MSRKNIILIIAIAIIIGVLLLWKACGVKSEPAARHGNKGPVAVDIVVLGNSGEGGTLVVPGTIMAGEEVSLKSEVAGRVSSINFEEGGKVSAGQLLVTVEQPSLTGELARINAEINLASSESERRKRLLDKGGISREEYEQTSTRLATLQSQKSQIAARVQQGRIVAPFSGTAGLRMVSPGSYVNPQDPITTITQGGALKVEFNVPERIAGSIKEGMPVSLKLIDGTLANAVVYATAGQMDAVSRTLAVRANVKSNTLVPGSFAEVILPAEGVTPGFPIPTEALVPELDGTKVFVKKQGKAQKVKVETGQRTPFTVDLVAGVNRGDTVIISGLLILREGMAVEERKEKQAE